MTKSVYRQLFQEIKEKFPGYASFTLNDLQKCFYEFRHAVIGAINTEGFKQFAYLSTQTPDYESRLRYMMEEKKSERQKKAFEDLVWDMSSDLDSLIQHIDNDMPADS